MTNSNKKVVWEQMDPKYMSKYEAPTPLDILELHKEELSIQEYNNLKEYFTYNTLERKRKEIKKQIDDYNKSRN